MHMRLKTSSSEDFTFGKNLKLSILGMTIMMQCENARSGVSIVVYLPNFGRCEVEIGLPQCVYQGSKIHLHYHGWDGEVSARLVNNIKNINSINVFGPHVFTACPNKHCAWGDQ